MGAISCTKVLNPWLEPQADENTDEGRRNTILVHFPFPMRIEKFVQRMGAVAMGTIAGEPCHTPQDLYRYTYPAPIEEFYERTYFLLMKRQELDFQQWIVALREFFRINRPLHNNNLEENNTELETQFGELKIIRDSEERPLGIVVAFRGCISFDQFDAIVQTPSLYFSYVSKTTVEMDEADLQTAYQFGFFAY